MTTRHQQTDVHESLTKQDRNNINDPQKKHRLGTVSKNILREGLNRFNGLTPFYSNQLSGIIINFRIIEPLCSLDYAREVEGL